MTLYTDLPITLPDPDDIRTAIAAADEQAKLLRRLLRIVLQLHALYAEEKTA